MYVHPLDRNLCIKIFVNGNSEEYRREEKYYRLLAKRNISWEMLPKFHGFIATNLGRGAFFDLVRDYDGDISKTLEYYVALDALTAQHQVSLCRAVLRLKEYLNRNRVITMTLKTQNILFRKLNDQAGDLVLVDSVRNSDLLPICNYSAYLAQKKILRKWQRFETSLLGQTAASISLHRMLENQLPDRRVNVPEGCRFASRCPKVIDVCRNTTPELIALSDVDRQVACHLY